MFALNARQDIPPVIAMLNKIAQRKSVPESRAQTGDTDYRNSKVPGGRLNPFDPQDRECRLIQRRRRKCVCFVRLERIRRERIRSCKRRTSCRTARV